MLLTRFAQENNNLDVNFIGNIYLQFTRISITIHYWKSAFILLALISFFEHFDIIHLFLRFLSL